MVGRVVCRVVEWNEWTSQQATRPLRAKISASFEWARYPRDTGEGQRSHSEYPLIAPVDCLCVVILVGFHLHLSYSSFSSQVYALLREDWPAGRDRGANGIHHTPPPPLSSPLPLPIPCIARFIDCAMSTPPSFLIFLHLPISFSSKVT